MASLRVSSNHQTPCDLVWCLACSAIPHPKTCTNQVSVCPAPPCRGLLSPSSSWCHLLLLSCSSLWESASPVPPVLRSYSSFQTSKSSRGWLVVLIAIQHLWGEEDGQELLQKCGGRGKGDASLLLMQDSTLYFAWRVYPSPALYDLPYELQRVIADAATQREGGFSAALFPLLEDLLSEEEAGGTEQLPEGGLSCLLPKAVEIEWSGVCHEASIHWSFYLSKLG